MTRTAAREIAVQIAFAAADKDFALTAEDILANTDAFAQDCELYADDIDPKHRKYILDVVSALDSHLEEIDGVIQKYSKTRLIGRISRTALACMRVALCEMLYMEDIPVGATINSIVEIDKGYDDDETVRFVNGVLGSVAREFK